MMGTLRKYGKPCSYTGVLIPEEIEGMMREAGFVVEESTLLGEDIKALCVRGRKVEDKK